MFVIGLTGGIGSGKSTAADMFAELGAGVVDTDAISHELTAPGGAAIPALREAFGADYIAADGALDRAKMRALVFGDPAARKQARGDPASADPRGSARAHRAAPTGRTSSWSCRCCSRPAPIAISRTACWSWTAPRSEQVRRDRAAQRRHRGRGARDHGGAAAARRAARPRRRRAVERRAASRSCARQVAELHAKYLGAGASRTRFASGDPIRLYFW